MREHKKSKSLKLLLFGGSGRLGTEISKYVDSNIDLLMPSHVECDISNELQINNYIEQNSPNVIINSAAIVGVKECDKDRAEAWKTNVVGAVNIARNCLEKKIKLIHISTAVVFDGKRGYYKESDIPIPTSYYAITKVAAEQAVLVLSNSVVIRLDLFSTYKIKYNEVFTDHYTSKISDKEAAQKIMKIVNSGYKGIINVGGERASLYKILKHFYPSIKPIKIADSSMPNYPKDISLDLSVWKKHFEAN